MPPVKVAAAQFTVTNDQQRNLQRLLGLVDEAASSGARLVLFPEFCNHPTWYPNQEACWDAAIEIPGTFIGEIQKKAKERAIYVAFNATVRGPHPTVYDQNHLISPNGEIIGMTQKQVLMYIEKNFYTPGTADSKIIDTDIGRIGMYSCMDGLVPETTRVLALRGAQVLLNSLASNALDEGHTHIPARAVENKVWIVSSNRSGPIVDAADMDTLFQQSGIPLELLKGGGESQVVSPSGEVLVRARLREDDIVYATIDPEQADDKSLSGGGDLFADRRPETYSLMATPNEETPYARRSTDALPSQDLGVAALQAPASSSPRSAVDGALEMCAEAVSRGSRFLVLPELFPFLPGIVAADPIAATEASAEALRLLQAAARQHACYIATSLVEEEDSRRYHTTFLIDRAGDVAARYRQIHVRPADRVWATPGDQFVTAETPMGLVGLMAGYDGLFLESARVLARMGADLICYPTSWTEAWETEYGARERVAENHLQIVAANRPDSLIRRGSMILRLPAVYTFPITGEVNAPEFDEAPWGEQISLRAALNLTLSRDKKLMGMSDLLMDVRPELYATIVAPNA